MNHYKLQKKLYSVFIEDKIGTVQRKSKGQLVFNKILLGLIFMFLLLSLKLAFSASDITKAGPIDPKKALSKDEYGLYKATYLGRTSKIKKLIQDGVNINVKSPNSKRTPLHIAASRGKAEIVKTLIDNGADMNASDNDGKTPLYMAIESKKDSVINYLLSKGAKVTKNMLDIAGEKTKKVLSSYIK